MSIPTQNETKYIDYEPSKTKICIVEEDMHGKVITNFSKPKLSFMYYMLS